MEIFQARLAELMSKKHFRTNSEFLRITTHWDRISKLDCTDEFSLGIQCREAIHDALDERTEYLLSLKQSDVLSVLVSHISHVVDVLDDPGSPLNTIALGNKEDPLLSHYFDEIRPLVCDLDHNKEDIGAVEKISRNTIWISLIFRMLCWLLLHDFDKADVKLVPSDLKLSRMPVFIG